MKSYVISKAIGIVLGALSAAVGGQAAAQQDAYPTRFIRMVVPQLPGGTTDILGRIVGQKITEATGQQVVVDNRSGAGGNIGTELVAKSKPDGYTLLTVASSTLTINPSLFSKMPFDTLQDLAPIINLAEVQNVLITHPSIPVTNTKELIALAKARPGQLSYGSSGSGQSTHLGMELFKSMAGVNILHIPYKGGSLMIRDVVAGHIFITMNNIPSVLPHVQSGRLRPLAVSGKKRSPALPQLPTIDEAALPGYENSVWYGLLAPAGTPAEIVNRLNGIVAKALKTPELHERLLKQGAEPVGDTPEECREQLRRDLVKWAKVIKDTGIKLD